VKQRTARIPFSTPTTLSTHRKKSRWKERVRGEVVWTPRRIIPGEWAVLRVIAGRAGSVAPADFERECPELSAAEFRRFLKAANETDPDSTARADRRARIIRALLALVLLAGLAVFLAGGRKEGAARAAEFARVQREVCRSALRFAHRTPDVVERLCPPSP
jgi:hypothetical protein